MNQKPSKQIKKQPSRTSHTAFHDTMAQARTHMSPVQRGFSLFIHWRPIEVASDIIGATLARPTAITVGSSCALLFTGVMYITAKRYGYDLSGSEAIWAFVFGWTTGVIIDYITLLIRSVTRKRS